LQGDIGMRKSSSVRGTRSEGKQQTRVQAKANEWGASKNRTARSFSTIEVSHLFDISKATLYRWEREGLISMPSRDWRNWRLYTSTNITEIKTLIRRRVVQ
jgi:hypothetical protein